MSDPLVRLANRAAADDDGLQTFWGRAHLDGMPYRGRKDPLLTDAEFEEKTSVRRKVRHGFFNLKNEDEANNYLNVLDGVANGWYVLWTKQTDVDLRTGAARAYLEWVESYLEDGSPTPDGRTEVYGGQ